MISYTCLNLENGTDAEKVELAQQTLADDENSCSIPPGEQCGYIQTDEDMLSAAQYTLTLAQTECTS
jgi:hypothetical protein